MKGLLKLLFGKRNRKPKKCWTCREVLPEHKSTCWYSIDGL